MNLVDQSLKIMEGLYDPKRDNIIAFSGGKDSIALLHLAKQTGLQFVYRYYNTTIDPPKHISFIRNNYSDVNIIQPKYSFYELIERRGLPTRGARFCCQALKEYDGKGCKVFEGLRKDESFKRGERLSKLKEPEMCDTRIKGKTHVYPIINWKESDIWMYIKSNGLPYPSQYDEGFTRLGCVGCPLAQKKQRIKEFKKYPKFVYAIINAIRKNMEAGKSLSIFSNPYEAFYWWLSEVSLDNHFSQSFFAIDYETVIKNTFPLWQNLKS